MSKLKTVILVLVIVLAYTIKVRAQQDTIDIPLPPEPKEFNFDFKGFPGLTLTPEQEKKILKDIVPKIKKELEEIKKLNKLKYYNLLTDLNLRHLDFPVFGKRNKEAVERRRKISELEIETESLGLKYQNSGKAEKDKLKAELQNKLNELFELRESNRKEEVNELEKRLSELKQNLQERRENKSEIVRKRMLELIGESRNIEW